MGFIKQIKVGSDTHNIRDDRIITLADNGTTTAGTWLAKVAEPAEAITAYKDGQLFLYKITKAGASTTTLNINGLGAKTVYRSGTSKLTTQFGVGNYLLLAYNSTNTCFRVVNFYDSGGASGDYLPLSGGTIDGSLTIAGASSITTDQGTGLITLSEYDGEDYYNGFGFYSGDSSGTPMICSSSGYLCIGDPTKVSNYTSFEDSPDFKINLANLYNASNQSWLKTGNSNKNSGKIYLVGTSTTPTSTSKGGQTYANSTCYIDTSTKNLYLGNERVAKASEIPASNDWVVEYVDHYASLTPQGALYLVRKNDDILTTVNITIEDESGELNDCNFVYDIFGMAFAWGYSDDTVSAKLGNSLGRPYRYLGCGATLKLRGVVDSSNPTNVIFKGAYTGNNSKWTPINETITHGSLSLWGDQTSWISDPAAEICHNIKIKGMGGF